MTEINAEDAKRIAEKSYRKRLSDLHEALRLFLIARTHLERVSGIYHKPDEVLTRDLEAAASKVSKISKNR